MLTRGRTDRGGLSFCPIPFAGEFTDAFLGLRSSLGLLRQLGPCKPHLPAKRRAGCLCHMASVIGVRAVLVGELVGPHRSVASSRRLRGAKRPKLANIRTNQEARRATKAFGVPAPLFYRRPSRAPHSRRRFGG